MSGKYALIIGNGEYVDSGLAQLAAPGKDAEDLANILKDKDVGAFDDVHILLNEPSSSIIEAIDGFFDQKKPDDLLVLYFSGHGVRDEHGSLYLAVKNTNRNRLRSTAIKSDYIREVMDQSRSRRQVLILDCCNSGAFAQGTKSATGVSIGTKAAFEGGYGRIILTASDSTQYAWEGDKVIGETDNSLFTHYLVEGLKGEADNDSDGRITVDELYDFAYEKVRLATPKQTPSKFSSKQQGEIILRDNVRLEDTKVVPLPDDLMAAVKSSLPYVREGAIKQLELLLKGRNRALARSAQAALEKIVSEDDSRNVSQAASKALEAALHPDSMTDTLRPTRKPEEAKDSPISKERPRVEAFPERKPIERNFLKTSLAKWTFIGLIGIALLSLVLWGVNNYLRPVGAPDGSQDISAIETETSRTEYPTETETPTQPAVIPAVPEVFLPPVLEGLPVPIGSDKITLNTIGSVDQLALWGRGSINQLAYSPDGKYFAAATSYGIYLFDAGTLAQTKYLEPNAYVIAIAFSRDSKTLASSSWDNSIKLWNVKDGSLIRTLEGHSADVTSLAFSPNEGGLLASGSLDKTIRLWDTDDGTLLDTLEGHTSYIRSVAFSPNGQTLASGSDDRSIRLWRVSDGTLLQTLGGHVNTVLCITYSPDGDTLASGSADGTIRTWDTRDGSLINTYGTFGGVINSVTFSPSGRLLVAAMGDRSIRVLDAYYSNSYNTLYEHSEAVLGLAFSPDGTILASGSMDNTIRLWDFSEAYSEYALIQTLGGASGKMTSLAYSPDGQMLAGGSTNDSIRIWRVFDGVLLQTLSGHSGDVTSVAFSPDGKIVASGSDDNTVRLWYVIAGTPPLTLGGHQSRINDVEFSPDGSLLASASDDETIRIWRVSDGSLLFTLNSTYDATSIAFSPDGKRLYSCSEGNSIRLWSMETGEVINYINVLSDYPNYLTISSDGKQLAVSFQTNSINILQTSDDNALRTLKIEDGPAIYHLAFSPDGNIFAAAASDDKIYLWNANDGTILRSFDGHTDEVIDIAFSPDGRSVASASLDGTVRIWGIPK